VNTDTRVERFRALYESTRPRVLAYALRRTPTPEDAADVVAETFTIAWRRLDDVPDGEGGLLWLYATGRRVVANNGRRARRRAELVDRIGAELAAALALPDERNEGEALMAAMALDRVSDDDRELLMLAGWEGLGPAELARLLGCSPAAARVRLHRARARLATEMGRLGLLAKPARPSRHLPLRDLVRSDSPEEAGGQ
jgi:RNA polymerase sigma-70 factor (ECF subfamily)